MSQEKTETQVKTPGQAQRGAYFVDDPCIFELESTPWEIIASPIGKGSFKNWKQYLITPSLLVYRESFQSATRLRGLAPPGLLSITLPLNLGSRSRYWNAPPDNNGLHASLFGCVDAVFDSGQSHLMALIDLQFLRKTLPEEIISRLENAAQNRFIEATPKAIENLTHWLCRVLHETEQHQNVPLHPLATRAFEEEFVDRLARTVRLNILPGSRPRLSRRQYGMRRAIHFLHESNNTQISIPQLCKEAEVSQRTLEYAFREQFNLTPLAFFKMQRLHQARYALMTSIAPDSTVTQIAHQHGFLETGRFAAQYCKLFGELPSITLRKKRNKKRHLGAPLLWSEQRV